MNVRKNLNHLATRKGARYARAFSKSDWFLADYGGKKSTKFISLYTEFSKRADPDPDCKEIIKLIDDQEFMNVQSELDRLKNKIDTNAAGVEALERSCRNAKRILDARLREKALSGSLIAVAITIAVTVATNWIFRTLLLLVF